MNPNGLTDEQIAARPEPFVGMVMWSEADGWRRLLGSGFGVDGFYPAVSRNWNAEDFRADEIREEFLLPGEHGCPWPPPKEFQHNWQDGDRAWINVPNGHGWQVYTVHDDWVARMFHRNGHWYDLDVPAIYIPEGEKQ